MSEDHHRLALPQGTRIRDFEFHRVLGHGGFGMTYLGWNIALDIPVAIKEYLPADLATRESDMSVVPQSSQSASDFRWGLERFLDEARTLARFQHPNIVRVHHFFEAHSTAYIAMDYVEGEDLSAYLTRKGTLSEDELKGILYPLLSALEVIHRADFLHRDIKPGNIVLRAEDGSPVLLDFGAARQAIGAKSRSVTSIVTPGYAPIEQYSSRGHQGPWTDIYALGGVCYRALTGQVPDDATDRMREDPLIPVSQRCAGRVSGAFLSAIDLALSVDEGDRPQSIGAWRETLETGAASQPERRQEETPRRDTRQAALEKQRQEQVASENQRRERAKDLHTAAKQSDHQAALFLLRHGAAVNARDHDGNTPLHSAAKLNALEVARVLLNHGAAANAKNNNGWTPYSFAEEVDMLDLLSRYERLQESSDVRSRASLGRQTQQGRIASRSNKSTSGEENMGCIAKALVGMGILVLIGLLSC